MRSQVLVLILATCVLGAKLPSSSSHQDSSQIVSRTVSVKSPVRVSKVINHFTPVDHRYDATGSVQINRDSEPSARQPQIPKLSIPAQIPSAPVSLSRTISVKTPVRKSNVINHFNPAGHRYDATGSVVINTGSSGSSRVASRPSAPRAIPSTPTIISVASPKPVSSRPTSSATQKSLTRTVSVRTPERISSVINHFTPADHRYDAIGSVIINQSSAPAPTRTAPSLIRAVPALTRPAPPVRAASATSSQQSLSRTVSIKTPVRHSNVISFFTPADHRYDATGSVIINQASTGATKIAPIRASPAPFPAKARPAPTPAAPSPVRAAPVRVTQKSLTRTVSVKTPQRTSNVISHFTPADHRYDATGSVIINQGSARAPSATKISAARITPLQAPVRAARIPAQAKPAPARAASSPVRAVLLPATQKSLSRTVSVKTPERTSHVISHFTPAVNRYDATGSVVINQASSRPSKVSAVRASPVRAAPAPSPTAPAPARAARAPVRTVPTPASSTQKSLSRTVSVKTPVRTSNVISHFTPADHRYDATGSVLINQASSSSSKVSATRASPVRVSSTPIRAAPAPVRAAPAPARAAPTFVQAAPASSQKSLSRTVSVKTPVRTSHVISHFTPAVNRYDATGSVVINQASSRPLKVSAASASPVRAAPAPTRATPARVAPAPVRPAPVPVRAAPTSSQKSLSRTVSVKTPLRASNVINHFTPADHRYDATGSVIINHGSTSASRASKVSAARFTPAPVPVPAVPAPSRAFPAPVRAPPSSGRAAPAPAVQKSLTRTVSVKTPARATNVISHFTPADHRYDATGSVIINQGSLSASRASAVSGSSSASRASTVSGSSSASGASRVSGSRTSAGSGSSSASRVFGSSSASRASAVSGLSSASRASTVSGSSSAAGASRVSGSRTSAGSGSSSASSASRVFGSSSASRASAVSGLSSASRASRVSGSSSASRASAVSGSTSTSRASTGSVTLSGSSSSGKAFKSSSSNSNQVSSSRQSSSTAARRQSSSSKTSGLASSFASAAAANAQRSSSSSSSRSIHSGPFRLAAPVTKASSSSLSSDLQAEMKAFRAEAAASGAAVSQFRHEDNTDGARDQYSFNLCVEDSEHTNYHCRDEWVGEDGITRGWYTVLLPDAYLYNYTYIAHPVKGYQVSVTRRDSGIAMKQVEADIFAPATVFSNKGITRFSDFAVSGVNNRFVESTAMNFPQNSATVFANSRAEAMKTGRSASSGSVPAVSSGFPSHSNGFSIISDSGSSGSSSGRVGSQSSTLSGSAKSIFSSGASSQSLSSSKSSSGSRSSVKSAAQSSKTVSGSAGQTFSQSSGRVSGSAGQTSSQSSRRVSSSAGQTSSQSSRRVSSSAGQTSSQSSRRVSSSAGQTSSQSSRRVSSSAGQTSSQSSRTVSGSAGKGSSQSSLSRTVSVRTPERVSNVITHFTPRDHRFDATGRVTIDHSSSSSSRASATPTQAVFVARERTPAVSPTPIRSSGSSQSSLSRTVSVKTPQRTSSVINHFTPADHRYDATGSVVINQSSQRSQPARVTTSRIQPATVRAVPAPIQRKPVAVPVSTASSAASQSSLSRTVSVRTPERASNTISHFTPKDHRYEATGHVNINQGSSRASTRPSQVFIASSVPAAPVQAPSPPAPLPVARALSSASQSSLSRTVSVKTPDRQSTTISHFTPADHRYDATGSVVINRASSGSLKESRVSVATPPKRTIVVQKPVRFAPVFAAAPLKKQVASAPASQKSLSRTVSVKTPLRHSSVISHFTPAVNVYDATGSVVINSASSGSSKTSRTFVARAPAPASPAPIRSPAPARRAPIAAVLSSNAKSVSSSPKTQSSLTRTVSVKTPTRTSDVISHFTPADHRYDATGSVTINKGSTGASQTSQLSAARFSSPATPAPVIFRAPVRIQAAAPPTASQSSLSRTVSVKTPQRASNIISHFNPADHRYEASGSVIINKGTASSARVSAPAATPAPVRARAFVARPAPAAPAARSPSQASLTRTISVKTPNRVSNVISHFTPAVHRYDATGSVTINRSSA